MRVCTGRESYSGELTKAKPIKQDRNPDAGAGGVDREGVMRRDIALSDASPSELEAVKCCRIGWPGSLLYRQFILNVPVSQIRAVFENETPVMLYHWKRQVFGCREVCFHSLLPASRAELREVMGTCGASIATMAFLRGSDVPEARRMGKLPLPRTSYWDIVVDLPKQVDDYFQLLGENMREQLPRYERRLRREFGDRLEIREVHGPDITFELCSQLVSLVGDRMRYKGGKSLWTPQMLANISVLAQECGQVMAMWLDGKLIGGTLCFLHQNEAHLWAIAHDPAYNRFRVGNVCFWKTIIRHIEMGFSRHHFGQGEAAYKFRFGGRLEPLESVTVFASVPVGLLWHSAAWVQRLLRMMRRAPRRVARFLLRLVPEDTAARAKESRLGRALGRLFH